MQCRQTIVGWLKRFILLSFTLGITFAFYRPALALASTRQLSQTATDIVEVSPPETIQKLRLNIDRYSPQVKILSPAADQLVKDDTVSVRFEVRDLLIFKDKKLGLGPHLSIFLDNKPYQEVYDLGQPLILKKLAPGTHTIRAIANRPWFESFKNPGAYAQTTFHIFTRTEENNPSPDQPLLTYGQPQGLLGTDTVLFDFYLSNLPKTKASAGTEANWQVLVSINGSTFYLNDWQPLYLQGLKPGKNWVRFELTDQRGQKIENAFNDTIRVVEVQENGNDVRSKLVRGELSAIDAGGIVDPNYKRPQPTPAKPATTEPSPASSSKPEPKTIPAPPQKIEEPKPNIPTTKQSSPTPAPQPKSAKSPKVKPSPALLPKPEATQPKDQEKQSAGEPIKSPIPSKVGDQQTSKAKKSQPSSPSLKTEPSQLQQESNQVQTQERPTAPAKSKSLEKPSAAKPVLPPSTAKKDSQPKSATQKTPTSSQPKPEKLQPKAADQPIFKPPTPKSVSPKQETPSLLPAPQPNAGQKEAAPKSIGPEKDGSPMESGSSQRDKGTTPGNSSSLQGTFTKFWDQIRSSQEQTKPSKTTPPLEKKETVKEVEPKPTPVPSSAPVNKAPAAATPPPAKSSQRKAAQRQEPATTIQKPSPLPTNDRSKLPASSPLPDQTQSTQGQDSLTKGAKPTPSLLTPPTSQPKQPESSVFSSWRDRWQQQKQTASSPAPEDSTPAKTAPPKAPTTSSTEQQVPLQGAKTETTPSKTVPAKTTDATSVVQQKSAQRVEEKKNESKTSVPSGPEENSTASKSAFSVLRDRWQQQKQLMSSPAKQETTPDKPVSPKSTNESSVVKPTPSNSMSKKMAPAKTSTLKPTDAPDVVKFAPKEASQNKKDESQPSASSVPDAKSAQSETSIFSSWRDRWQQQKQLISPPASQETSPISPKSTETATILKSSPSSATKQAPSQTAVSSEGDAPPSRPEVNKPEPITFDPGVFYRRFLSQDSDE